MTAEELVRYVMDYAQEHYEDGWDVVVETFTAEEIAEWIRRDAATTPAEALKVFADVVSVWEERREAAAQHRREAVGEDEAW